MKSDYINLLPQKKEDFEKGEVIILLFFERFKLHLNSGNIF